MPILTQANPSQNLVPTKVEGDDSARVGGQPSQQVRPFIHYARRKTEPGPNKLNASNVAFGSTLGPDGVPPIGFYRRSYLLVSAVGGTSAGAAVAANDAPWNVIQTYFEQDIGGQEIIGVDGYGLMLLNALGGYEWNPNPVSRPSFSAVQLTSGAGCGNFQFGLYIPHEANKMSAYGALPNENASALYQQRVVFNPAASVYTTPPGTLPTLTVAEFIDVWTKPPEKPGVPGSPVGLGSTFYWTMQTYPTIAGYQVIPLTGRKGNIIHTHLYVFRDNTGQRYNLATVPDFRLRVNDFDQIGPVSYAKIVDDWFAAFGVNISGAAGSQFGGVIPISFRQDFDDHPAGDDSMERYLPTSGATRLELALTLPANGAGGSLTVYTGDLIPRGAIPYAVA